GIGNIYADEALWAARVHGAVSSGALSHDEWRTVLAETRLVMSRALDAGGTSFDALYVNVNGESGYFDVSLNAYGQAGKPCARCGTPIVRVPWQNRSSHFCPECQPAPARG
ncbi:MAG: bifunctional DNA-formamidopyrimidine glycosylase/DNA-(apurinic or apyrimidinic site) lyase, partial [Actinomycetota bacterium]